APGAIWPARLPGAGRLRRTRTTGGYRAGPVRPAAGAGTPPGRPVYPRATEAIRMSYRAVYIYMPLLALALALAWVVGQRVLDPGRRPAKIEAAEAAPVREP